MRAFVSLHTEPPIAQMDHEVSYAGYHRLPVEFDDAFGHIPVRLTFPAITQDSDDIIKYIAVGPCETGQGEIFMRVHNMPYIPCKTVPERATDEFWIAAGASPSQAKVLAQTHSKIAPVVCIANSDPVVLPEGLNPIARIAHKLVYAGLITTDELHPKLFEAINDALYHSGVPVLKVTRSAAATMTGKMSQIRLSEMGSA